MIEPLNSGNIVQILCSAAIIHGIAWAVFRSLPGAILLKKLQPQLPPPAWSTTGPPPAPPALPLKRRVAIYALTCSNCQRFWTAFIIMILTKHNFEQSLINAIGYAIIGGVYDIIGGRCGQSAQPCAGCG